MAISSTAGTEKAFPFFYQVILSADRGVETHSAMNSGFGKDPRVDVAQVQNEPLTDRW